MRKRPGIAELCLLLGTLSVPGWGQSSTTSTASAENGKKLFLAVGCYECHGREGQGGSAAPVGSTAPRIAPPRIPLDALRAYVRHPAGAMPPYTVKVLSDADIDRIYAFLKTIPVPRPVSGIPLLNH